MGPAQNGFSSNSASFPHAYSAGPIVSGGDGAVSRPDAGKKKRTWAIIAGVGFLILAVALAVVAVVINGGRREVSGNIRETFNRYANYVLYGNDSMEDVADYDEEKSTVLEAKITDSNYLNEAVDLYTAFYNKTADETTEAISGIELGNVNDWYGYLIGRQNIKIMDMMEMFKVFLNDGVNAAREYANGFYNEESDNYLIQLEQSYRVTRVNDQLRLWEIYRDAGCYSSGKVEQICIEEVSNDATADLLKSLGRMDEEISEMPSSIARNIVNQCISLVKAFNGEGVSNEEN